MPGVLVCALVALSATFLSEHFAGPQLLYALLLGLSLNFLTEHPNVLCGVNFCAKTLLRAGVALLGARITLSQISGLGIKTAVLVCGAVVLTIGFGLMFAKILKRPISEGLLSGCAVGICGASAALAISALMPRTKDTERFTLLAVVGVTVLSTLAMVLYPLLLRFLDFSSIKSGIFLGATIHDVAQVVAAGMILGQSAGDTATVVKLFRVALLMPVGLIVAMAFRHIQRKEDSATPRPALIPGFLLFFIFLVVVGSTGFVDPIAVTVASDASRWLLVIAIAAAGVKTNFGDLLKLGWQPVVMLVGETFFIAILALTVLLFTTVGS